MNRELLQSARSPTGLSLLRVREEPARVHGRFRAAGVDGINLAVIRDEVPNVPTAHGLFRERVFLRIEDGCAVRLARDFAGVVQRHGQKPAVAANRKKRAWAGRVDQPAAGRVELADELAAASV